MRSSLTSRALIVLFAAFALLASACGGGDESTGTAASPSGSDSASASASEPADDTTSDDDSAMAEEDDNADDTASDDDSAMAEEDDDMGDDAASSGLEEDPPADEDPADSDDPATSGLVDDGTSAGGDFCALYEQNRNLLDEYSLLDPVQVEEWFSLSQQLLIEAIGDAPGELIGDLETLRTQFDQVGAILQEFEYDLFAAGDAVDALPITAEADAATDRLDIWVETNCVGAETGATDLTDQLATEEGIEAILGSETGRELFIDGMTEDGTITRDQASCLLDNIDPSLLSILAGIGAGGSTDVLDPQTAVDLLDVFAGCGIDPSALG